MAVEKAVLWTTAPANRLKAWRVDAVPYWLFVDSAGRVAATHRGPLANLEPALDALERGEKLPPLVQPPAA